MTVAEIIREFCELNGYEYYEGYSGRYMYGRKCPGIVCEDPMMVMLELADHILDTEGVQNSLVGMLGCPRTDSLGLDRILYFPVVDEE